jgi:RNA polymerase sigma-70 factor (ECF subfamily)
MASAAQVSRPAGSAWLAWIGPTAMAEAANGRRPRGVSSSDAAAPLDPETTIDLVVRAKTGDRAALDALCERCLPALRRWARGRLPRHARGLLDTGDLVQETVLHALPRLAEFEPRHQGALQAYLRQAVANRIRDEVRRAARRPVGELPSDPPDAAPSPLERAIGRQGVERYERALQRLRPEEREAVVNRIELQLSYEELAVALAKPTPNAARVAVTRALARLIEEMDDGR